MMFPGIRLVSHVCFSFVSFTYLSARSDFPCDFCSWVVCDNFPFYQRTWLFGPYISVQLIFIMQKCIEDAVPSLVERLPESQSWSQAAEYLCSPHGGTSTSVLTCTCLCVDSLFLYLDQLYYSQDLIWGVSSLGEFFCRIDSVSNLVLV